MKLGLEFCLPVVLSPGLFVREGSDMSRPTIGANIIRDLDLAPSVARPSDLTRRNSDVANPVESK